MSKKQHLDEKSLSLNQEPETPPADVTVNIPPPPAARAVPPLPPNYVGYPNLRGAYLYFLSRGDTPQEAGEYLENMITLAGPSRDTRTYIDNGSSPRRLLNVGAARLEQV